MLNVEAFDYAAIAASLVLFALGSFYDMKTREVNDWVWVAYGTLGLALTVLRLLLDPSPLFLTLVSIAVTTLVSFGMFYLGLFGGADAKAIVCLGLAIPLPPSHYQVLIGYVHPVFPLVVVILGFVCSASIGLWLAARNFLAYLREGKRIFQGLEHEAAGKKILAMITGYRTDLSKLRSTFYLYPMEEIAVGPDGAHQAFKLFVSAESDRDQLVSNFVDQFSKAGFQGRVWVTPGLPMLVFLFLGLIIALIFGDLIFASVMLMALR